MLAQQRSLMHVHGQAEGEGGAHAHPQRLVHAPEHQHQCEQVGHPGGAAEQADVEQHVGQQGHHQAEPDEDRVGGQQQLLAGAHDHGVLFPAVAAASSGNAGSGSPPMASTITCSAACTRATGSQRMRAKDESAARSMSVTRATASPGG